MLVRRELSTITLLLRIAGIVAIAAAAFFVWYLNPVRYIGQSSGSYYAPRVDVVMPIIPKDILTDERLGNFEPSIAPPVPPVFGRPDPFASLVPLTLPSVPETPVKPTK